MCTNCRWIENPYTHKMVFVRCGKCDACKQEKANVRKRKIDNHFASGQVALFVTLTYDDRFLPYLKKSEITLHGTNSIYRDFYPRNYTKDGITKLIVKPSKLQTKSLIHDELYSFGITKADIQALRPVKSDKDKVGVIYYEDIKNFHKRLRQILVRDFQFMAGYSAFNVAEYGPTTFRPHFHLLIFINPSDVETFKSAVVKAWPYADSIRTSDNISVAENANGYVSSYVNCGTDLPKILQTPPFRQKHSHSRHFGLSPHDFSLPAIIDKAEKKEMSYSIKVVENGTPTTTPIQLPAYVVNRYFPVFKRYTALPACKIHRFIELCSPYVSEPKEREALSICYKDLLLRNDEWLPLRKRLYNSYCKCREILGSLTLFEYATLHIKVWNAMRSYTYKHQFDNVFIEDMSQLYDNVQDVVDGYVSSPTLLPFLDTSKVYDANNFKHRKEITERYHIMFERKQKQKKVTAQLMDCANITF